MVKTSKNILDEARATIKQIDIDEARRMIEKPGTVLLDVRESDEWRQGHIAQAVAIPRGLPGVADRAFTAGELTRYSRHFVIPEVGEKGQAKLLDARVLVLGAGALGSPSALYLAAAGVGTIGLVDFDVVDLSNLQRQIIHTTDRVGMPKTESAQKQINALNPGVRVVRHDLRLTSANAMDIIKDYDVIVNCGDNFPTR